jgi:hypothetical protein
VQQENGCIGCDGIDLVDRWQAFLGKLMFGKAADNTHPLRGGRDGHLSLQHVHRIGKRAHAVPAEFHVEVETAAYDVGMVIDQAGQYSLALEVNDFCVRPGKRHDVAVGSHVQEQAILDGDCGGVRICAIQRRDQSVAKNDVCVHGSGSGLDGIGGIGR